MQLPERKTMLTIFTNLCCEYECIEQALSEEQSLKLMRSYKVEEAGNIVATDVGL